MGEFIIADNLVSRLFLEVEFLSSSSSACSVLHDFLLFIHCLNKLRSLRVAFWIDSFVHLTRIEILVQLSLLSLLVSNDMESGSGFSFEEIVVVSDSRHDFFVSKKNSLIIIFFFYSEIYNRSVCQFLMFVVYSFTNFDSLK